MLPNRDQAVIAMRDFGLDVVDISIDTPSVQRVRTKSKRKRNIDGFYQAWSITGTNLIAGFYGTYYPYKETHKFHIEQKGSYNKISDSEKFRINSLIEKSKKAVEVIEPDLKAFEKANFLIGEDHPYLEKKGLKGYGLKNIKYASNGLTKELLIPYYNRNNELRGVQRIFVNGKKRMIEGSKMKGAYHLIEPKKESDIYAICEGYATGATICEATGWNVVCCYSASNMMQVARYFKHKTLIVCADNDLETENRIGKNTGVDVGIEVSDRFLCPLTYPKVDGDFNDIGLADTKKMLLPKTPKSLLAQVLDLDEREDQERFLMSRKSILASYDKAEFSFLKNRLKEIGLNKGFIEDIILGEKSENEIIKIEEAKEKLKEVRFDGKSYYKLSGNKFYNTTSQEISLLVSIASDDDSTEKQELLNSIHKNKLIGELTAECVPFGKSETEEFIGSEGKIIINRKVSVRERLESIHSKLMDVSIDTVFIEYVKKEYPEVIDVMTASLARKFSESKKAFVYFKCCTSYGKTFFFDLDGLARTFTKKYCKEEFRGNAPEDFIEPLFLFIDEADCFPSEYKVNNPEYKKLYGGLAKTKLGMRILACANQIEDIERGIDEQLQERIIIVNPKPKRLNHLGIERTKSRKIWFKWIVEYLISKIDEWNQGDGFFVNCEKEFEGFVKKYSKGSDFVGLESVIYDCTREAIEMTVDNEKFKGDSGFSFKDYLHNSEEDTCSDFYFIQSPRKFVLEAVKTFDESRLNAVKNKYKSLSELSEIDFFEYSISKIKGKTRKGFFFKF